MDVIFIVPITSNAFVNDCCIVFFRSGWEFQICESYGTQKNEIKNDLKLRRSDSKRKQCNCGSIHWLLVRIGLDLWELHSEVEGDECELVSQL